MKFADFLNESSEGGVRYGYKVDAETAKSILEKSSPRKYVSSEIARHIVIDPKFWEL